MNTTHDPYQPPLSPQAEPEPAAIRVAGRWRRFGTYLVDYAGLLVVAMFVGVAMAFTLGPESLEKLTGWREYAFSLSLFIAYYVFFEGLWGRTPGKWVCGTRVVDELGMAPRIGQVLGRTFARFIPFEPFSLLFGDDRGPRGWHDSLPKTWVVLVEGRG